MVSLKHLNIILLSSLIASPASAFVLLSATEEAILDVSPTAPTIAFTLSAEHPPLEEKGKYKGGAHADLSDADLWPILVQDAMDKWNEIRGAYIELQINPTGEAAFDAEDKVHSIVVGGQGVTSAALANPQMENGIIVDCDIKVGTKSVEANSLFYTLVHELGHCLGLGHNHSNYTSIMSYSRDARTPNLGADDIAGAIYLYPDPNVSDAESKEMIGCGVLQNKNSNHTYAWWLVLLPFLVPLSPKLARVRRR